MLLLTMESRYFDNIIMLYLSNYIQCISYLLIIVYTVVISIIVLLFYYYSTLCNS